MTARIKDECLKNRNRFPRWSQQYGSFITVYDSRLKKDEPVKEVVNAAGEAVNDPMNGRSDTIKNTSDTINGTINQRREGINEVYEGINEGIKMGVIEHRGSKKTGGYYAVK